MSATTGTSSSSCARMGKKQGRNPESHILLDPYKAAATCLYIHLTTAGDPEAANKVIAWLDAITWNGEVLGFWKARYLLTSCKAREANKIKYAAISPGMIARFIRQGSDALIAAELVQHPLCIEDMGACVGFDASADNILREFFQRQGQ